MSSKGGGGAEGYARQRQYDYRANSNLVLTAETRTREATEPSGEPETLWNNMKGKMGDRVQYGRPEEEKKVKKRKEPVDDLTYAAPQTKRRAGGGVLDLDSGETYRPKTRETQAAYETLLSLVQGKLGDYATDVIAGAADEVLGILKSDKLKDPDKQTGVGELFGAEVNSDEFFKLVTIGKMITDFQSPEDPQEGDVLAGDALDEEAGVAVEFEGEDADDDDDDGDEVLDAEDDQEDGGVDATGEVTTGMKDDGGEEELEEGLHPQDIDAYWLQRRISKACEEKGTPIDADKSQQLATDVFRILQGSESDREVENLLVTLLEYDKFDMIKELLRNRLKIVWCIRLERADHEDRKRLEVEMRGSPATAAILETLNATRATAKERHAEMERKIRQEARQLRQAAGGGQAAGEVGGAAAGRHQVDIDSLAFNEGSHTMSNEKCELPNSSYRTSFTNYEEVHVPALAHKPFGKDEKLKQIKELPEWTQAAFRGMKELNRIQSRVCDTALKTAENMLICAPTGAGKTNCSMLAILHQMGVHQNPKTGKIDTAKFKIVYIAPMKALVAEMVGNFSTRLEPYGIKVRELTGDINLTKAEIEETQIIVTTPEKWDIITRKSGDRAYTQLVKLVIIDEIHLLHDERGPVLESIVARTVRQIEATQEMIRLVGLSATLPNFDDVATFLRVKHDVGLFYFDNSFRPCPLAQQYIGVRTKKPLQRFRLMNEICYAKVLAAAGKHQVLIFVHSRKETAKTAKYLKEEALREDKLARFMGDSASREVLRAEAETTKNSDLAELLPYGIAIHHAGMARTDRTMVEELFGDKHIQVLVSTATLAWGVNLPAHTVIIKGTQVYNPVKGAWGELSPLDVMQMFGRAGRPQFDSFGEGIIITGHSELRFYLSLFNMQLPIESQYVATIPDNLNAEIVLGTVTNLQEAADWLGYTYLYVRMLINGNLYGVPLDAPDSDPRLSERRLDLVHSAATLLAKNNLITYERRSGTVQATDLGRIASHYYIKYTTLATYNEHLKPTMGDIELLRLFALSDEFKYIIVRDEEKLELAKLLERVPIPVKEGIEEPIAKVNVLLQAYISQLKLEGLAMSSDMVYVTQSAGRLMRCLFEICLKRGWAGLTERALQLCKMINKRMWGCQTPLRQFKGIPTEVLARMEKKDLAWERYYDLSAQELGELIRVPKLGKSLHRFVHQFPRLELAAHVQPITRTVIKVDLTITPDFQWEEKAHGFVEPFWILVEDSDGESLLHSEYFLLKKSFAEEDHTITFTIPISEPLPPQYFVRVVSDKWLSCEAVLPVSFRHLLLPEKNPPPTEALDLQALPITVLRRADFESLYSSYKTFNAIQTQAFNALFQSDDNCLIAAPTGSGKTICAEFALLRMIQKATEGKCVARCVYIAPMPGLAAERFADWSSRFGGLGLNVVQLVGETAADVKAVEKGNIIISSPEHWDMLSRRWKQRKNVQNVPLFIVDELHLVGGRNGPVIEVIVSRMRQISNHNKEQPIRIVGLSTSLANAKDVGEWIGASAHGLFNFPASVRPVPLELHVQGIDLTNMEARMQAMARPAYAAIGNYARDSKPALLFVPTRRLARSTALDMLTFAAAEGTPQKYLQVTEQDLEPYLAKVNDRALQHSLRYGVGFLYETMPAVEKEVVNRLFASGAIQVVTATAGMCWGMTLSASLVVVMGTQYYDASGATGGADYSVTDLLQIMGRASRPGLDTVGRVVLMCHSPRKEYYKKFLFEPFPVESHLDHALHDHFVAEIGTRTVQSKQDAVDYLTWTFLFRRILQNPNYYNLQGRSHRHLSDHLSDLTESALQDLVESNVIVVKENDMDLELLNLGMISSYYYISYTTIELFSSSLTAKTKLKGLLDIVTTASELDDLPMRPGEEETVRRLLIHAHLAVENGKWTDPHTKANALLQSHFSRTNLSGDMQADQRTILPLIMRLLQACVDVVSSNSWLNPALAAMEMSQMVVQGMWERDSLLLQLPHFDKEKAAQCKEAGIESVFDLMEMKDEARRELLQMAETEINDIARVCNRYPDIHLEHKILGTENEPISAKDFKEPVPANSSVAMQIELTREQAGDLRPVDAPRFPTKKEEQWWLVVGDSKANTLLAIKRVSLQRHSTVKLAFQAPSKVGSHHLMLYFMCDSYMGCDQEYEFDLNVTEAEDESSDDMED